VELRGQKWRIRRTDLIFLGKTDGISFFNVAWEQEIRAESCLLCYSRCLFLVVRDEKLDTPMALIFPLLYSNFTSAGLGLLQW